MNTYICLYFLKKWMINLIIFEKIVTEGGGSMVGADIEAHFLDYTFE